MPLTDRETQILVPNIVERSGALTVFSHDPDGNRNGMQQYGRYGKEIAVESMWNQMACVIL